MWRTLPFVFLISSPVYAVPVVPNFTQGSSTSRTETSTVITESVRTSNFNSGYTYSVTGSGVEHDGSTISAPNATITETVNGTTYTWTGLDLGETKLDTTNREMLFNLQGLQPPGLICHRRNSHDPIGKRNRYNYNILTIIGLFLGVQFANTSNTAAP